MNRFRAVISRTVHLFAEHHLPRSAAGLSYFLTLAVFPMLFCLYMMLGRYFPAMDQINEFLADALPATTIATITDYLRYVSENSSPAMLIAALFLTALASSAAFRLIDGAMISMREEKRFSGLFEMIFSFLFSLIFLAGIYIAVLLIVTGGWFLEAVDRHIASVNLSAAWSWARFLLMFLLLYLIFAVIFKITAPRRKNIQVLPGALMASAAIVGSGILFSYFISFTVRELIYGSLASIMIMMFWIYVCGLILLAGGALNVALEQQNQ